MSEENQKPKIRSPLVSGNYGERNRLQEIDRLKKLEASQKLEDSLLSEIEANDGPDFKPEDLPLKKRIFFAAMIRSFGNITQSCQVAGIKRKTYSAWRREDENFRRLIDEGEFEDRLLDFAESKLIHKIEQGDVIATIFFLKTKGKRRGYIEGNHLPPPERERGKPTWFDSSKVEEAAEVKDEIKNANNAEIR